MNKLSVRQFIEQGYHEKMEGLNTKAALPYVLSKILYNNTYQKYRGYGEILCVSKYRPKGKKHYCLYVINPNEFVDEWNNNKEFPPARSSCINFNITERFCFQRKYECKGCHVNEYESLKGCCCVSQGVKDKLKSGIEMPEELVDIDNERIKKNIKILNIDIKKAGKNG